jgi:hypothetical protein
MAGREPIRARAAALLPAVGALALFAIALDLIPIGRLVDLAEPGWAYALAGLAALGIAAAALVLRGPALGILGPALVITADLLIGLAVPGRIYNAGPMAEILAPQAAAGVAILAEGYHGEYAFTARLRSPVDQLPDLAAGEAWLADHPGGALIARMDGVRPPSPPSAEIVFRDRPHGIWIAPRP